MNQILAHRARIHTLYAVIYCCCHSSQMCCVPISIEDTIKEACGKMDLHFYIFLLSVSILSPPSSSAIGSRVLYSSFPKLLWAAQNIGILSSTTVPYAVNSYYIYVHMHDGYSVCVCVCSPYYTLILTHNMHAITRYRQYTLVLAHF